MDFIEAAQELSRQYDAGEITMEQWEVGIDALAAQEGIEVTVVPGF